VTSAGWSRSTESTDITSDRRGEFTPPEARVPPPNSAWPRLTIDKAFSSRALLAGVLVPLTGGVWPSFDWSLSR